MEIKLTENGVPLPEFSSELPLSLTEDANKVMQIMISHAFDEKQTKKDLVTKLGLTFGEAERLMTCKTEEFEQTMIEVFGE